MMHGQKNINLFHCWLFYVTQFMKVYFQGCVY